MVIGYALEGVENHKIDHKSKLQEKRDAVQIEFKFIRAREVSARGQPSISSRRARNRIRQLSGNNLTSNERSSVSRSGAFEV